MQDEKIIGENIRKFRKLGNYSQEQFAKALGISVATLSAYETGKTAQSMAVLTKIASLFNTSLDSVLGVDSEEIEDTFGYSQD